MADPARRDADGPGRREWATADIRQLMAVTLQAVPPAVAGYLASGCDGTSPAAAMLDLVLGVLRHLDETVRRADVGAAVAGEVIARAVEQDREQWPRPRGYPLRAVLGRASLASSSSSVRPCVSSPDSSSPGVGFHA